MKPGMKVLFGHIYFTFKDSNCVYITSSRGYVKGKYAAMTMVALGAADGATQRYSRSLGRSGAYVVNRLGVFPAGGERTANSDQ